MRKFPGCLLSKISDAGAEKAPYGRRGHFWECSKCFEEWFIGYKVTYCLFNSLTVLAWQLPSVWPMGVRAVTQEGALGGRGQDEPRAKPQPANKF